MDYMLEERRIFLDDVSERKRLEQFLKDEGIRLDKSLEYTVGIYDAGRLIASGSFFRNTLRCLAVNAEYQGLGVMNKLVTHLTNEQYQRGYTHIFVYTKPEAVRFFKDMGFYEIVRVADTVVFLENKSEGIHSFAADLSPKRMPGSRIASIVMNANPFTLGHLHLVERAAAENDVVHIFVVTEEASVIPFAVRYELIRRGTRHLKNIVLHQAGSYIISSGTFPSYFIKDDAAAVAAHAKLDLELFLKYIAPALGIQRRYVGEEPYCEITKKYNCIMKEALDKAGLERVLVPRMELEGEAISASRVRALIREDSWDEIRKLVPETTYEYFKCKEAEALIQKIKNNIGRH